jgi:hypothetical protein
MSTRTDKAQSAAMTPGLTAAGRVVSALNTAWSTDPERTAGPDAELSGGLTSPAVGACGDDVRQGGHRSA